MVTVDPRGMVTFRFTCPNARHLYLVGDFNHWDRRARPMERDARGAWVARMWLEPGTYQFKYISEEGWWYNDHAAFGLQRSPFGWNSTVVVGSAADRRLSLLPPYRRERARAAARAERTPPAAAAAHRSGARPLEALRAVLPCLLQ